MENGQNRNLLFLITTDYSVGQPCLTSDGNTMYFTSDMPGGFGGADIYRITKDEKGEWGKPENLGDKINTEGDEMFPFFEENNKYIVFLFQRTFWSWEVWIFLFALLMVPDLDLYIMQDFL
jgi:hypothetical protein